LGNIGIRYIACNKGGVGLNLFGDSLKEDLTDGGAGT